MLDGNVGLVIWDDHSWGVPRADVALIKRRENTLTVVLLVHEVEVGTRLGKLRLIEMRLDFVLVVRVALEFVVFRFNAVLDQDDVRLIGVPRQGIQGVDRL